LYKQHAKHLSAEQAGKCVQQEAQLSQRDRPALLVVDDIAKSLKIIRNDIVE